MQAHAVGRNVSHCFVQCVDMLLREATVFRFALVFEHHVPAKAEIGRVELKNEPGFDDRLILRAHGVSERLKIGLMRWVVFVRLEERDDTRRGGVHEGVNGSCDLER